MKNALRILAGWLLIAYAAIAALGYIVDSNAVTFAHMIISEGHHLLACAWLGGWGYWLASNDYSETEGDL